MSNVTENIKEELLKRCKTYNDKYNYDFWNEHIKSCIEDKENYKFAIVLKFVAKHSIKI